MNLLKAFIIFATTLSLNECLGQKKDSVKIVINIGADALYPHLLDSVIFSDVNKKPLLNLVHVPTKNGAIAIKLPYGFYLIRLKAKGFKFSGSDCITVCSQCDNNVHVDYFPENSFTFDKVWLWPLYKGKINYDFRQTLNRRELNNLRKLENFPISFFITRYNRIADIMLDVNNLSKDDEEAIKKGLNSLKNWRLAEANGRNPADGFFTITLTELLKD
ncbi:MAG: hypothetical protein EON98_07870 [Chitinophagaceae bacterium]|nr:MAG: hypothetical protein EON98_07870 [Chitinophagaceae bacterium]